LLLNGIDPGQCHRRLAVTDSGQEIAILPGFGGLVNQQIEPDGAHFSLIERLDQSGQESAVHGAAVGKSRQGPLADREHDDPVVGRLRLTEHPMPIVLQPLLGALQKRRVGKREPKQGGDRGHQCRQAQPIRAGKPADVCPCCRCHDIPR
jgi:hypothetical protein